MTLAELQHQFAASLQYQALGETCAIQSDQFTAEQRMQIYRNNYIMSLSDVLAATYPMLVALLGDECFAQIARQHVLLTPLTKGDVNDYGAGLVDTLSQFPNVLEQAPYSAEVARFEWTLDCTRQRYDAATPSPCQHLSEIAALPAERHGDIHFRLPHGALCFDSEYALFDLHTAIHEQTLANLELHQPQHGLVYCDGHQVISHAITDQQALLCRALNDNQALQDIVPELLAELEPLIQQGLICGFSLDAPTTTNKE